MPHHHASATIADSATCPTVAIVGSPNSGKTTLFNALTGLRAKTGNYPGVTVSRYLGTCSTQGRDLTIEDLPGTYSLDPISPDEQIVVDVLDADSAKVATPQALLVTLDATALRRGLGLLAQVMHTDLPICVVVNFTDELVARGGALDVAGLSRALGVPVVPVVQGRQGIDALGQQLATFEQWTLPPMPPPTEPTHLSVWQDSILAAADYRSASPDETTRRIDQVLLHPVWGMAVFLLVMFLFFQTIFTLAAPAQQGIETLFGWLGGLVKGHLTIGWLAGLIGDALLGGVGSVITYVPQIVLLFAMIALLEGAGYMSRAAFLTDRVMAKFGLEGRAFVALLSSVACAIPGIMATRTLPSARDRLATMMAAPLMTCSARLPVYTLLVGLLVSSDKRFGPIGAQGLAMFCLYLAGTLASMLTAWVFSRIAGRRGVALPFTMEMPPYRMPRWRTVVLTVADATKGFLRKITTIILATTVVLWVLLNLPAPSDHTLTEAGVNPDDATAVSRYTIDHSAAAWVGRAVQPVFAPLGFDWRVNVGVLSSLSAREVFVATLGQIAAAEDPEDPAEALSAMTFDEGEDAGQPVFTPGTVAGLLVFFLFALQCLPTMGVMRRESGSWRWPLIAAGYMFALAWLGALTARLVVGWVR